MKKPLTKTQIKQIKKRLHDDSVSLSEDAAEKFGDLFHEIKLYTSTIITLNLECKNTGKIYRGTVNWGGMFICKDDNEAYLNLESPLVWARDNEDGE